MDFANAELRLKQWIKITNENRQKYIQFARAKELTPEQKKYFWIGFLTIYMVSQKKLLIQ
jgi:hypothetical protein